jgi:hypothetical protein
MSSYVNAALRRLVAVRADFLCEYCLMHEDDAVFGCEVDHIISEKHGGPTDAENLAYACTFCNGYRYNFTTAVDPHTQTVVPLFNPRTQQWAEHFLWTADGVRIVGTSPIGRATCSRLDVNDERHNDGAIMTARRLWVKGGWHPPVDDPRQKPV